MKKNNKYYGLKLKVWLIENDYTTADFADLLGISRTYLSLILNGRKNPGPTLKKLIRVATRKQVDFNKQIP